MTVRDLDLGGLLCQTAGKYPDHPAVVFMDSMLTYRRLDEYVDRLAGALHGLGLAKGDVVGLMLPNSPQFVISFFACQRLGLIVTALNPTYRPLELKHQLGDSGAKALVVLDAVYAQVAPVIGQTGIQRLIVTNIVDLCGFPCWKRLLGRWTKKIPHAPAPAGAISFMSLLRHEVNLPRVEIDPARDLACLQYTGGTTGKPKGAMLSHRNLIANLDQALAWVGEAPPGTGWVGVLPLFHVFALTCCMNLAVASGGFMLLFPRPPQEILHLAGQLEKWGKGRYMVMAGVASLFDKLVRTPGLERFDLSSLYRCLSGAGPLPAGLQAEFEQKIGTPVVEGYGMSEASPIVTANPFDLEPGTKRVAGSIGLPLPGTDCCIMDLAGKDEVLGYGPDQLGELCVRGPQVMQGYFNHPEETERVLRDGWLHTGDVAYMDEGGWIYFVDRKRDLVKRQGYSVFPQEVEALLLEHPAVDEAAVLGATLPTGQEQLKAYIVLRDGQTVSADKIKSWCRENMAPYKVPDTVEFRDCLPKTLVGKVLRRVLRDEAASGQTGV